MGVRIIEAPISEKLYDCVSYDASDFTPCARCGAMQWLWVSENGYCSCCCTDEEALQFWIDWRE